MNKEQQIEEMMLAVPQKIVAFDMNPKGQHLYGEQRKEIAEALYNAGYRKTFTSDLASDTQKAYKEGYIKGFEDGEEELKNEIYALKVQIECLEEHCTALEEDNINDEMNLDSLSKELEIISSELSRYTENAKTMCEETKKQAVKEFAEKLQKELPCRDYTFNGITFSMILTSSMKYVIDKLLKEYEV